MQNKEINLENFTQKAHHRDGVPRPTTAIYPGTFDPVTRGHLDIIKRARKLFDFLYVGIGVNSSKSPLFTLEERMELLMESTQDLDNVRILSFDGLLVDLFNDLGADAIVRGMRALSDFEYEFQLGLINRRLNENAEFVFLIPSAPFIYLNSTVVKTIAQNGGDCSTFVTPNVEAAFKTKFKYK